MSKKGSNPPPPAGSVKPPPPPSPPPPPLTGIAAGWRLRAIALEQCGVMLASKCLRECAEELEAFVQKRQATRTSWFQHEADFPICGKCGHPEACEAMGCKRQPNAIASAAGEARPLEAVVGRQRTDG